MTIEKCPCQYECHKLHRTSGDKADQEKGVLPRVNKIPCEGFN